MLLISVAELKPGLASSTCSRMPGPSNNVSLGSPPNHCHSAVARNASPGLDRAAADMVRTVGPRKVEIPCPVGPTISVLVMLITDIIIPGLLQVWFDSWHPPVRESKSLYMTARKLRPLIIVHMTHRLVVLALENSK
jgi:hypothetical protein